MKTRWLQLLALGWCGGCASADLTQVVVVVEAEPSVLAQAETLSVTVYGESVSDTGWSDPLLDVSDADWTKGTYTIALSPQNADRAGRYLVEASAHREGSPIATARLISGYVQGETRYVRLLIEDQCVGVTCDSPSTCTAGECTDAEVDPSTFAPSNGGIVSSTDGTVDATDGSDEPGGSEGTGRTVMDAGGGGGSDEDTDRSDGTDVGGDDETASRTSDAGSRTSDASSRTSDAGSAGSGSCSGSTPHGCYVAQSDNPMGCPPQIHEQSAYYPPMAEWEACSSPYYRPCNYTKPTGGAPAHCDCDLGLHWLCTY